jgi:DNA polymerase zeta
VTDIRRLFSCASNILTNTEQYGYLYTNYDRRRVLLQRQHLTVLSIELHCRTRGDLRPDPEFDSICGIFYHLFDDSSDNVQERERSGVFILDEASATSAAHASTSTTSPKRVTPCRPLLIRTGVWNLDATYSSTENELLESFVEFIVQ